MFPALKDAQGDLAKSSIGRGPLNWRKQGTLRNPDTIYVFRLLQDVGPMVLECIRQMKPDDARRATMLAGGAGNWAGGDSRG